MKRVQGKKRVFQDWKVEQFVTQKYKKTCQKKKKKKKVTLRAEKRSFSDRNRYKVAGKKNLR